MKAKILKEIAQRAAKGDPLAMDYVVSAGLGIGLAAQSDDSEAGVAGKLARLGYYINDLPKGGVSLYKKSGQKIGEFDYVDDAVSQALKLSDSVPESGTVVDAIARRAGDKDLPNIGYRGGHTAPVDPEYHAPLHEMNKSYPDDIYSDQAARYYGHGDYPLDKESMDIIQSLRGKPDEPVDMYRAVPLDSPNEILPGDWVTVNENYARTHGEGLDGYKILKSKTKAKRLRTDANSPHEFGYTGAIAPIGIGIGASALMTPEAQANQQMAANELRRIGRQDLLPDHLKEPVNTGKAVADILGSVGHGFAKESLKGLGAISGMIFGDNVDEAIKQGDRLAAIMPEYNLGKDAEQGLRNAYQAYMETPRADNEYLEPRRWLEEYLRMPEYWGDKSFEATGSPAIGAGVKGLMEMAQ